MKWKTFLFCVALVTQAASAVASTTEPAVAAALPRTVPPIKPPALGQLPSLAGATQWLHTEALDRARLRGKVVLVNFWTYSCINSLRQIPYIRAWADKYRKDGLVVIGVHAPEFDFEHDVGNVRRATRELHATYPVAIDNDHRIWDAFDNQYWPALYFIDAQGRIRHVKFGEGDYAASERVIQQLLTESGAHSVGASLVAVDAHGAEAAADWSDLRSPENYVGYARTTGFASPAGIVTDRAHHYSVPPALQLNQWSLMGDWAMGRQAAVSQGIGGRIRYRFHARDLHLVMAPSANGQPVRFRVTIDGKPPGAAHGVDVDSQGHGVADTPRMYQLIRQPGPVVDRQFDIEFLDPGIQAFAFTFG